MTAPARFPWPFDADAYRYGTDLQPARTPVVTAAGSWGADLLDVDEDYASDAAARTALLAADPLRCQELAHMRPAAWDAALLLLAELERARPDAFRLTSDGHGWRWRNAPLGIDQRLVLGDDACLPTDPLRWVAPQVQEDLVLLDQREGALWLDAGVLTAGSGWSLQFDLGAALLDVHAPVPRVLQEGVLPRVQRFLLQLPPGQAWRRTNWTTTAGLRRDAALETADRWRPERRALLDDAGGDLGERVCLRVEVQHVLRTPLTHSVLFLIRTHLLPLADVARVPAWRAQLGAVLAELPDDLAEYKGLTDLRGPLLAWLARS